MNKHTPAARWCYRSGWVTPGAEDPVAVKGRIGTDMTVEEDAVPSSYALGDGAASRPRCRQAAKTTASEMYDDDAHADEVS